jgi:predicted phage terminase large subunit-like protein
MKVKDFSTLLMARPHLAAAMKKDFPLFCRQAWPHLHPGTSLSWTWAHDLLCEWLMAVWQKKLTRLILNTPPRFAKSSIAGILFPVWGWLQDPTRSFLCCSYEIDLATSHNGDRRRLMDSQWFKNHFADAIKLSTDRSLAGEFSNTAGGLMQAASTNSKAQGRGGDIIIVDDPLSADAAYSEVFRNETNSWFVQQLPQRLNDPSQSSIILIMQRLHQNDPTGFLLSQEDSDWTLVKLPLIAEEDESWTFPISGRIVHRKKGECLDPGRWSKRVVKQRQQNRLVWAGQFQQQPADPSGNMIRVDDIQYYGGRDPKTNVLDPLVPTVFDRKVISVDSTFKDRPANDFVVVIVVGILGARRYLLHVTNAHLNLDGTLNEIRNARNLYGPISAVLIEDKANGSAIITKLGQEIPGVVAVNPEGGKLARVVAMAPEFQAHDWYIERNGPWAHKIVEQLTMFPNAKFDDIADAISQASIWLQANTFEENSLISWMKKVAAGDYDACRKLNGAARASTARSEGDKGLDPNPSTCSCGGVRVWMSQGIDPNKRVAHCQQCSMNDNIPVVEVMSSACPNHPDGHKYVMTGGAQRCMHCGDSPQQNMPANGLTKAQYRAGARAKF